MFRRWVWILCALMLLPPALPAQEFAARAARGDAVMTTEAGDAYLEAIAPALHAATSACLDDDAEVKPGETITLVAWVTREGAWSALDVEPAIAAAECLGKQLLAKKLPSPARWEWERGEFPLTLSVGKGRGAVDGLRYGD